MATIMIIIIIIIIVKSINSADIALHRRRCRDYTVLQTRYMFLELES